MASLPVNRIKKKNIMSYNGELCIVLECLVRTPPNNASYVQMELRSIKTGAKIPVRCGIGVSFDVFDNSTKSLEMSYEADGSYVFVDTSTNEEYYISAASLADSKEFLISGTSYMVLFVEDKPITVDLPRRQGRHRRQRPEDGHLRKRPPGQRPALHQAGREDQGQHRE